jgi:hypothetical protein
MKPSTTQSYSSPLQLIGIHRQQNAARTVRGIRWQSQRFRLGRLFSGCREGFAEREKVALGRWAVSDANDGA